MFRSIENTHSAFQAFWLQIKIIFLSPQVSPCILFPQKLCLKVSTHWLLIRAEWTQIIIQKPYHTASDIRPHKTCSYDQSQTVHPAPLQARPLPSFLPHTGIMFPMETDRGSQELNPNFPAYLLPLVQIPAAKMHEEQDDGNDHGLYNSWGWRVR